eukprot:31515-Pelagococcus_subviridis.AAC.2
MNPSLLTDEPLLSTARQLRQLRAIFAERRTLRVRQLGRHREDLPRGQRGRARVDTKRREDGRRARGDGVRAGVEPVRDESVDVRRGQDLPVVGGAFESHWSPYDRVGVVNADP